jgi:hypothetical protein
MYRGAVLYQGVWLAPGSEALVLHREKKLKELDLLMKACDQAKAKLEGRTSDKE